MIIGRWYFRIGRSVGLGLYFDGIRYAPVVAYVRGGRAYLGKGAELCVRPFMLRWVHVLFSVDMEP